MNPSEVPMTLSPRMAQVVVLIGRDAMSYTAAARALGISPRTVEAHATRVRDLAYPSKNPRQACVQFYWRNQDRVEQVAA